MSFVTRVNDVTVDPRILPMNRILAESIRLPGLVFRLLDADPAPSSIVDVLRGFSLTFHQLPQFSEMVVIRDAIVAVYRSGDVQCFSYLFAGTSTVRLSVFLFVACMSQTNAHSLHCKIKLQ